MSGTLAALPNHHFSLVFVQQLLDGETVFETDTVPYTDSTAVYRRSGPDLHFYSVSSLPGGVADTTELYTGTLSSGDSALTLLTSDGDGGIAFRDEYER